LAQSGSRRPHVRRPLIIERPDLQTGGQRWLYLALTIAFWLFYLYLWLPLITLAGWAFGLWRGYDVFVFQEGYRSLAEILLWYALGISAFSGALVAWAIYNWLRFRGKERRKATRPIGLVEQARYFGVIPYELGAWRRASVVSVTHDPHGRIVAVTAFARTQVSDRGKPEDDTPAAPIPALSIEGKSDRSPSVSSPTVVAFPLAARGGGR
jgi:biofilm PGA synthesis protein PgaD